jgi:hypothetical protein
LNYFKREVIDDRRKFHNEDVRNLHTPRIVVRRLNQEEPKSGCRSDEYAQNLDLVLKRILDKSGVEIYTGFSWLVISGLYWRILHARVPIHQEFISSVNYRLSNSETVQWGYLKNTGLFFCQSHFEAMYGIN